MNKYGSEKWGRLGRVKYIRFTPEWIKNQCGEELECGYYSSDDFNRLTHASGICDVEIANDVEGNYECVCEDGIEIY